MSTVDISTVNESTVYFYAPPKFMIFGKISGNIVLGVTVGNLDKENNEVEHLGKSAQYCVHFLPIARTVSPISGEKL